MTKLKLDESEQAGFAILSRDIPADLIDDIIRLRRRKKANLTERVAKRLMTEYKLFGNPEQAAEIQVTRGWVSFEASWVRNVASRPPTPFQQRHQDAINAFDDRLGYTHEQSTGYDIDLERSDFRTH